MKPKIFFDEDVKKISPLDAVTKLEEVFIEFSNETFLSPPRHYVKNDNGAIAFTIGGHKKIGVLGFRVYDTFPTEIEHQQFVTVFDAQTGALKGIVFGEYIGALRTGAIGGVAIKHLSRADSSTIGVIGSGLQARTQLVSACSVRDIKEVFVYSRNEERRKRFAVEMEKELGVQIVPVGTSEKAVSNADIVIAATTSGEPVFDANWLKPGTHVTTVGPKFIGRHELDPKVADSAKDIFTDSIKQLRGYPKPHFLSKTPHYEKISSLDKIISKKIEYKREATDITLFLSVGLSGTEPVVANLLF